ncbi:MAG: helix-turn-helix transcriptional regulator [Bdellovibrionaceae bacterium]|nr:helix-turn-helix transcriptional regulator [Pseudobdellovibrionaceae bacterium]
MKILYVSQNELSKKMGKYFKKYREKKGLQQKDVANALGYSSPQFISNMERGLCMPPISKLKKLISLYDMPAEEVLNIILEEQKKVISQAIVGKKAAAKLG